MIQINHKRIPYTGCEPDRVFYEHKHSHNRTLAMKIAIKKSLVAIVAAQFIGLTVHADPLWQPINKAKNTPTSETQSTHQLSTSALLSRLAVEGQTEVAVPLPSGKLVTFKLTPSVVMAPELSQKYPQIQTFHGVQVDNPANTGRFDMSPNGFYGVFNFQNERVYIDPVKGTDARLYRSYRAAGAQSDAAHMTRAVPRKKPGQYQAKNTLLNPAELPNTSIVYRIAFATTGEYAAFHGGTKEKTLAAIVTMVNRLNDVYHRDLAMTFELIADNDKLIYLDASNDPFNNTDEDIDKLTEVINTAVGVDSYDIGHLVSTGGGGLAGFEVVCTDLKAEGLTGSETPTNDAFHIDYVAHEVGHQLGADHTFNGSLGACGGGNRADNSAYEPGSASTIMGYAGICDEQNLQANSDPFFHIHSLDQMNAFSRMKEGKSCGKHTELTNNKPVVNAGRDYTIPARTPFTLTGSATDANTDTLSYSWQQFNLGATSSSKVQDSEDDGKRPLFRAFSPIKSASRTLPKMVDILSGNLSYGEAYATSTRDLDFRLIVRDGKGGVSDDAVKISVVGGDKGFSVLSPDGSSKWQSNTQLVQWHTANSDKAPVSCAHVDILLSLDSGLSFPITLANQVENNGQYEVSLQGQQSAKARVLIKCSDNIFFAVNQGDFTINPGPVSPVKPHITGQSPLQFNEDSNLTLKVSDIQFATAQTIDKLTLSSGENYTINNNSITPKQDFNGELNIAVTATRGQLTSDVYMLKATVQAVNDAPIAQDDVRTLEHDQQDSAIDVLSNDTDVDNDSLKLTLIDYKGKATVSIKSNKLSYTPEKGFSGTEHIIYTVSDEQGWTATATLAVTVSPAKKTETGKNEGKKSSSGSVSLWLIFIMLLSVSTRYYKVKYD